MSADVSLEAEVEAVLARRSKAQDKPTDADLQPVYNYLRPTFPSSSNHASSSTTASEKSPEVHWFCSKTPSSIVREAATYLIFLFAFQRIGTSKEWVDALEQVLKGCDRCARGFGAARRGFGAKYVLTRRHSAYG
jgi:senataxin